MKQVKQLLRVVTLCNDDRNKGKNITPSKKKCGKVGLFILNQLSSEMKSRAQGQTQLVAVTHEYSKLAVGL